MPIPQHKTDQIIKMLAASMSVSKISTTLGVGISTIYRVNKIHNIRKIRVKRPPGNITKGIPGQLLSELEKKYTVAELSEKLYYTPAALVRWRSGRGNIDFFKVQLLADLAGYEIQLIKKEPHS